MGTGKIKDTIKNDPQVIWSEHASSLGIDKQRYFEYFKDSAYAIGIVLKDIQMFAHPISLSEIRKKHPTFSPPQTFRYLNHEFLAKIIPTGGNKLKDTTASKIGPRSAVVI
jgi:predicted transcriptional regulator